LSSAALPCSSEPQSGPNTDCGAFRFGNRGQEKQEAALRSAFTNEAGTIGT
jgi:hypothetical protein